MPDDRRQSAARHTLRQERPTEMRWVISALLVLGLVPRAFAADLDVDALRGSEPVGPALFTNWSGFYVGGQGSYANTTADFSGATSPIIASSLIELALEEDVGVSNWPLLGPGSSHAAGFGGFVGYNMQYQDLVVGVEGNYTHSNATVSASQSPILNRLVSAGGLPYDVNVSGTGTLTINDVGELRLRAGYILNNFLPYGFVGFALATANYQVTSCVYGQQDPSGINVPTGCGQQQTFTPCATPAQPSCVGFAFPNSASKTDALLYGFSVGGGLDYAMTRNFFLRGEFEYLQFDATANIVASELIGRLGVGLRF
jgi:outer membrane immunogenic protein